MSIDETTIRSIIRNVVQQVVAEQGGSGAPQINVNQSGVGRLGLFDDIDSAIAAGNVAFEAYRSCSMDVRARVISNLRELMFKRAPHYAAAAVAETGLGRVDHKVKKNHLVARSTPGLEVLQPVAFTGDHGLALHEWAPFGVIASITPCTNVTETLLNNGISMLAGGNAVVFNVHPSAKKVSAEFIRDANEAIVAAGAPENLMACVVEPTIESANRLMTHEGTRLVVVTGGPAVVKAAQGSGKRAICAGPGNPPVLVDDTANVPQAAKDIVAGAGLDNNIVCIVEKEILAHERIADDLWDELGRAGAHQVKGADADKLTRFLLADDTHVKREFVGKNAGHILKAAGLHVSGDPPIAVVQVSDASHPLVQIEQLMPIIPMFRFSDTRAGIQTAVEVEKGCRHTSVMHSKNIDLLHEMSVAVDTSIFVKNGPSYNGTGFDGEGYTAWTIAGPTGEGMTNARTFVRMRRCVLHDHFRIV